METGFLWHGVRRIGQFTLREAFKLSRFSGPLMGFWPKHFMGWLSPVPLESTQGASKVGLGAGNRNFPGFPNFPPGGGIPRGQGGNPWGPPGPRGKVPGKFRDKRAQSGLVVSRGGCGAEKPPGGGFWGEKTWGSSGGNKQVFAQNTAARHLEGEGGPKPQ